MFFFSSIQSSLQRREAASGSEKSPASAKAGATATLQKIFIFNSEAENEGGAEGKSIEVGTWVLVNYDGDLFPGIVPQVCKSNEKAYIQYKSNS